MRAYYLEQPLTPVQVGDVSELLSDDLEQVRIPYVLPADGKPHSQSEAAACRVLRAAGILQDGGRQVALVAPNTMPWVLGFVEAIHIVTGYYPYLIQTADNQKALSGNDSDLRIIDMHGAMTE